MTTLITIKVQGMTCNGCENSLSKALARIEGVKTVKADHASGDVTIEVDAPVDDATLSEAVDRAGFTRVV